MRLGGVEVVQLARMHHDEATCMCTSARTAASASGVSATHAVPSFNSRSLMSVSMAASSACLPL